MTTISPDPIGEMLRLAPPRFVRAVEAVMRHARTNPVTQEVVIDISRRHRVEVDSLAPWAGLGFSWACPYRLVCVGLHATRAPRGLLGRLGIAALRRAAREAPAS